MYRYKGRDSSGGFVVGTFESSSDQAAIHELYEQGIFVSEIKPQSKSGISISARFSGAVSKRDVEQFATEMALLLGNGVRVDRALTVIKSSTGSVKLRKILSVIEAQVRAGDQLSEALSKYPEVFDQLFINLVEAGEATGRLDVTFNQLSQDWKYRNALSDEVLQAVTYPCVILLVCVAAMLFVFNYIVPQMAPLFEGAGRLPVYTSVLLAVSDWVTRYQLIFFVTLIAIIVAVGRAMKRPKYRASLLKHLTKAPLVGSFLLTIDKVRVSSTIAMTLGAGIAIDKALGLATKSADTPWVIDQLRATQIRMRGGEGVAVALKRSELYPDFAVSLIEVGEETGELALSFSEITSRAREGFQRRVKVLTTILEPALILVMGGVVGGVVVIMLLSIVSVNDVAL